VTQVPALVNEETADLALTGRVPDPPLRIAHVTPVFPPYRGGMGTVAFHQARALADMGMAVTVFTPRGSPPRARPPGVDVIELPPLAAKGNAACLPQVVGRASGYDVVHLHYPFFGTAELLAARRLIGGPPLVVQYQMDVVGRGWRSHVFRWHRRLLLPLVLRAADAIVVTSRDYAASSFFAARLPALESRLSVIPAGVDLRQMSPAGKRRDARRRLGLPDAPTIFFLARLDPAHYFKGLHVLLDALGRMPGVGLVIGGDGESRAEYEALVRRLVLEARVHFAGDIPDEMLPAYYRAADVVTLPSVDRTEAFGLVLIEAMACGTPVVASRLSGVRALVEVGCNGYLAKPGDAGDLAEKLARCIDESATLGRNARAFAAERFSWTTIAEQLRGLYGRLTVEEGC
jgi:glycosyltransferase involved in cell wall biosynthesis